MHILLDDFSGKIAHYPTWQANTNSWFDTLAEQLPWQRNSVQVYGRRHLIPRLEAWLSEPGVRYGYSGQVFTGTGWPMAIQPLVASVTDFLQHPFNAMLANWYRDGRDSMGWHSDNEPELGIKPTIASLSFGDDRDFDLRHKNDPSRKLRVKLGHGDLLVMSGALQQYWEHSIPKRAHRKARISLTFRQIIHQSAS